MFYIAHVYLAVHCHIVNSVVLCARSSVNKMHEFSHVPTSRHCTPTSRHCTLGSIHSSSIMGNIDNVNFKVLGE